VKPLIPKKHTSRAQIKKKTKKEPFETNAQSKQKKEHLKNCVFILLK